MNLVGMPQVTVFLVTYVNFFDKCKLLKPKKWSLSWRKLPKLQMSFNIAKNTC